MPRTDHKGKEAGSRPQNEAQKQHKHEEVKVASDHEEQRRRTQALQKAENRPGRIITYLQRRYVGKPPQIARKENK